MGCYYASQIGSLESQKWNDDKDKFLKAMEDHKDNEWLDIKELDPLQFMGHVAKIFKCATGHHLKGLGEHTGWI